MLPDKMIGAKKLASGIEWLWSRNYDLVPDSSSDRILIVFPDRRYDLAAGVNVMIDVE